MTTPLTYSAAEVAERICGDQDAAQWFITKARTGRIPARKIVREWRWTEADIQGTLDAFANRVLPPPPNPWELSPTSLRRLGRGA